LFNHEPINIFRVKKFIQILYSKTFPLEPFFSNFYSKHKPIQKWRNMAWLMCSFRKCLVVKRLNLIDLGHLLYMYVLLKVLFRLGVGPVGFLFQSVSSTTIDIRTFYVFLCQAIYTALPLLLVNLWTIF
jgi:hypothetical protein